MPSTDLDLARAFAGLTDPRLDRTKRHELVDIVVIALCAVVCGADAWTEVEEFGRSKHDWLKRFLRLPNGIPSHDTFGRVFAALDPAEFQRCFAGWMAAACAATGLVPIAIDGKAVRAAARDTFSGRLHLVSAWAAENRLILAQRAVPDRANEQAAIPELLKVLDLAGAVVTIDAGGCYAEIAQRIAGEGGAYVLALKDNQPLLRRAVADRFRAVIDDGPPAVGYDRHEEADTGHGRAETRTCEVLRNVTGLPGQANWPGLCTLVVVCRLCRASGKETAEVRSFISSLDADAKTLLALVRGHWGIETDQADYPSRRRWVGTRRVAYHRRDGVARAGRLVPATAGRTDRRNRMSDTPDAPHPPAPEADKPATRVGPPAGRPAEGTPRTPRPTARPAPRGHRPQGGRS